MCTRKTTIETITAALVFLFLYTGLSKYVEHQKFVNVLHSSPLLSHWAKPIAYLLPGLEIATAICLTLPQTRLKALYTSTTLLATFTLYLAYILIFSTKLPCTCGGVISKLNWPQHIAFNLMFMTASIISINLAKNMHP